MKWATATPRNLTLHFYSRLTLTVLAICCLNVLGLGFQSWHDVPYLIPLILQVNSDRRT